MGGVELPNTTSSTNDVEHRQPPPPPSATETDTSKWTKVDDVAGGDGAGAKKLVPKARDPFGYRRDIDGLRALAVAAVVIYHCDPNWMPGGFVGVDVFFVISGYVVAGSLLCLLRVAHQDDRARHESDERLLPRFLRSDVRLEQSGHRQRPRHERADLQG